MEKKDRIYHVLPENIARLKAKIAFLQKRVAGSDLRLNVLGIIEVPVKNTEKKQTKYAVEVVGTTPKISGYSYVATIKHQNGLNLVNKNPSSQVEVPVEFWTAQAICQHCGKKRSRSETVILANEVGELKQIGKNCLADFLRSENFADQLAMMAELKKIVCGAGEGSLGNGREVYSIDDLISDTVLALESIKVDWIGSQDRNALIRHVAGFYIGANQQERNIDAQKLRERFASGQQNQKKINEVYEFWESAKIADLNNFQRNLKAVFDKKELSFKELKLGVGVALSVLCETEEGRARRLQFQKRAEQAESKKIADQNLNHFGTIGERGLFRLKVVHVSSYDTQWGLSRKISFEDQDGNKAVWFTSNELKTDPFKEGQFYTFKATIKAHGHFQGVKQTVLNRVSVVAE
jgi:hypothetical protein